MSRKIVVLGSNSFSGSDLIDLLLEDPDNDVIGISRSPENNELFLPYKRHKKPKFRFYQIDFNRHIADVLGLLDSFRPHYVVNYVALSDVAGSFENPDQWFETNTVSIARLADHLRNTRYLTRFLQISSAEVYGSCHGVIREDARINPTTPYAVSKAAADLLLFTLVKSFSFPAVIIRSTNVYGAHQQLFKIIPRAIINIKLGQPTYLHGGGRAIRSYIHIRDVTKGVVAALLRGKDGEIYHFSPRHGLPVRSVMKIICKRMGVPFTHAMIDVAERLGQDAVYAIDSSKARNIFGWKLDISLEEGIDGVIHWINDNWSTVRKLPREYLHKP